MKVYYETNYRGFIPIVYTKSGLSLFYPFLDKSLGFLSYRCYRRGVWTSKKKKNGVSGIPSVLSEAPNFYLSRKEVRVTRLGKEASEFQSLDTFSRH